MSKLSIKKRAITIMGGLCFILLSLVGIFSNNTPFSFIAVAITTVFGFVGFWIVLPFFFILGLYIIFKNKLMKFKVKLTMWGLVILILCALILSSYWSSCSQTYVTSEEQGAPYLVFFNSGKVFKQIMDANKDTFSPNPELGGGYIGFVLAGILNSAITPIGLQIVCWVFFVCGLLMVFNQQVIKIASFIKYKKSKRNNKKIDEEGFEEISLEQSNEPQDTVKIEENNVKEETPIFVDPPRQVEQAIYEEMANPNLINNEYGLKKAHFDVANDSHIDKPMQNSISEPIFKEPVQQVETNVISEETNEEIFNSNVNNFEESNISQEEINLGETNIETPNEPEIINEPSIEEINFEQTKQPFTPIVNEPIQQTVQIDEPTKEEASIDPLFRPQPKANLIKNYIYPSLDLLDLRENEDDITKNEASCASRIEIINKTLANFKVGASIVGYTVGPSVTRFDLQTNDDVSIANVQRYIQDISVRLNGTSVRFETIVPGKSTSGLEIPNEIRTNVGLRESISMLPNDKKNLLTIPFGKNISGELQYADFAKFPHMLVSGTTGSGKSIFIHSTILTLIMRCKPEELKLVLIDPKKVEMNYYDSIPHLLCPNISDPYKALVCFKKLVDEMERRYNLFASIKVRDIGGFNEHANAHDIQPLPYIVVFIDEFADLVDTCKEIRDPVVRIAQKARAAGIHMCIATQRPSVNVIDGTIKGNIATRVALMSASAVDSQTIIGEGGAEKLLGNGDMLIDCSLLSRTTKPRVQGCFVSENEINRVCEFLTSHYQPQFDPEFLNLEPKKEEKITKSEPDISEIDKSKSEDEQYQDIKEQISHREYCSISFIQRSFAMGFGRAGKIFHQLVQEGIVAPTGDSRGCKVLVYQPQEQQIGSVEQMSTTYGDED